jgi:hypothetical protein
MDDVRTMTGIVRKTQVIEGVAPDRIPFDDLMRVEQPAVLKGVAADWPIVQRGLESADAAIAYIKSFYNGRPVTGFTSAPDVKRRFFYSDDMASLNFEARRIALDEYLDRIRASRDDPNAPYFYVGSTDLDLHLPGLRAENDLVLNNAMFESNRPIVSLWLGNRTLAVAHYDMSNNIACCVVGRRRFTLFPPEQVHNLYPGPLELTPGGQVVTMVDIDNPDYERFPRFREALAAAQVAELEPGDILFYPALWWHQVEGLAPFNAMINYWWNTSPAFIDTPQTTLLHALLSLRDRPEQEKRAWRELFDYYVFGPADRAGAHLPENARGNLGPMDEMKARRLRAYLLNKLNR